MATDVHTVTIATEASGVLVDPSDTAANLGRHHCEVYTGIFHGIELQDDEMRAGIDHHLRREGEILGRTNTPIAAMDEYENRGFRAVGAIDIQLFDLRGAISHSLGRPDAGAHGLAVGGKALRDVCDERLVD